MKRYKLFFTIMMCLLSDLSVQAQDELERNNEPLPKMVYVIYKARQKEFYQGDSIDVYYLPELPVYPPLRFKNKREMMRYNRLVYNVKRVLPIAKQVNLAIIETYEYLDKLPDKKARDKHMKLVEKGLKDQYYPQMKKLTYSQGKLLIKLINRECNQSSYEIVQAFWGSFKAGWYQTWAALFGASLKKQYDAENDDKMTERVVRLVEAGAL